MSIGLSVGAVTVAGRLYLVFRYRHRLFGAEAGRGFAAQTLAAFDELLGDCEPFDQRHS